MFQVCVFPVAVCMDRIYMEPIVDPHRNYVHINCDDVWPLLLTWFNFNPSMDK